MIFIQIAGLFLGVFLRTHIPYIRKMRQKKINKFDKKYLKTAFFSAVLSIISVFLIVPQFEFRSFPVSTFFEGFKIFSVAFAFGFGWNSFINEGLKW